jgi:hypothetical protein
MEQVTIRPLPQWVFMAFSRVKFTFSDFWGHKSKPLAQSWSRLKEMMRNVRIGQYQRQFCVKTYLRSCANWSKSLTFWQGVKPGMSTMTVLASFYASSTAFCITKHNRRYAFISETSQITERRRTAFRSYTVSRCVCVCVWGGGSPLCLDCVEARIDLFL